MAKPAKISNNQKAVNRLVALLLAGKTVTVQAYSGYYTVGKYAPAVGPGGFAVYGYGRGTIPAQEYTSAVAANDAAWAVVSSCGSTRVREACLHYF